MTDSTYSSPEMADLEIIDRVARAAHLWIRHGKTTQRFTSSQIQPAGRQNLVAGLISGLCDLLNLDTRCAVYSAYAYALLDSEKEHALAIAYLLLNQQGEKKYRSAFQEGQEAAYDLVAILRWPELDSAQSVEYSRAVNH
jgi:hypothetical protein